LRSKHGNNTSGTEGESDGCTKECGVNARTAKKKAKPKKKKKLLANQVTQEQVWEGTLRTSKG